jgi:hypothetical protein
MAQLGIDGFSWFMGFLSAVCVFIAIVAFTVGYFELKNRKENDNIGEDTNIE